MVNTRDYYADLELPQSADVQDIKKQFRKLALKYHPDRNPGREQEVNSKFQIIQSAHEILTDPQQKAKYDASLARSGRGGQSANVKGNPWSHVSSQFPTPPRRNQANKSSAVPPGSGAQRWQSRFSAGVPPTAKQQTSADAEAKRDAARAFEGMRKPSAQTKPKTGETRTPSSHAPPPPPRTETARQRQQASFGNSRKSGYYPRSSEPGDEPPVASKHYSSRAHQSPTEPEFADARKQRAAPIPDPLSQFRDRERDPYIDLRQSTPYTTHGGEKTNPFDGVPISHTKSQKDSSRRGDHLDPEPPQASSYKNRSSSVPRSATEDGQGPDLDGPGDTTRPRTSSEAASHYAQPPFENPGQARYASAPGAPGAQGAMPRPGQQGHTADPAAKPHGDNGHSMYGKFHISQPLHYSQYLNMTRHISLKSSDSTTKTESVDKNSSRNVHDGFKEAYPGELASSGAGDKSSKLTLYEQQQHNLLDRLINNAVPPHNLPKDKGSPAAPPTPPSATLANEMGSNSFTFPVDDETFQKTHESREDLGRRSVDDINTQFTNEDPQSWQFQATSDGHEASHDAQNRSRNRKSRGSPSKPSSPLVNTDTNVPETPSSPAGGFDAHGWNDKFGPQTFVPHPGSSTSPTRSGRVNGKKTKATKQTAGTAAVVEEDNSDDEVYTWTGRNKPQEAESPQAMDIDSPPPGPPDTPYAQNGVRNIHVEPSRPEWRSGDVENVNGAPANDVLRKERFVANAAGSEDSEEFQASLSDLSKVEPFAAEKDAGLKSFGNLKDNLPFESQAAADVQVKLPKAPPLVFPNHPVAPRPPPTAAISSIKPNLGSWQKYVNDFEKYMRQWDEFNATVVDHFATRESQMGKTRAAKGYGFLAARGDMETQEYYLSLQQDNGVRRRWAEVCEEHETRFREFMAFREKMKSA